MFRRVHSLYRCIKPSMLLPTQQLIKQQLPRTFISITSNTPNIYNSPVLHCRNVSSETTNAQWTDDEFKQVLSNDKVVVFMKGTPDAPQCGFSKYVIQILFMHGLEEYKTLNVLDDDVLRSRVKEFSNWPTIPQIYMNGEFLGGFDIMLQMHQNGELIEELEKIGHRSALIDAE